MEESSFGRLVGVLVSPAKTFKAIGEKPTWVLALLVLSFVNLWCAYHYFTAARTLGADLSAQDPDAPEHARATA